MNERKTLEEILAAMNGLYGETARIRESLEMLDVEIGKRLNAMETRALAEQALEDTGPEPAAAADGNGNFELDIY